MMGLLNSFGLPFKSSDRLPTVAETFLDFGQQVFRMCVIAALAVVLSAIAVLSNYHASIAFTSGFVVAAIIAMFITRSFQRSLLRREIVFQEHLLSCAPPMAIEEIILVLSAHPDRNARRLGKLIQSMQDANLVVNDGDRTKLIKIADEVCRGVARVRVETRSDEVEPVLAALDQVMMDACRRYRLDRGDIATAVAMGI